MNDPVMHQVLVAGLPSELPTWLEGRLGGVIARSIASVDAAKAELADDLYSLLIVDQGLMDLADDPGLYRVRTELGLNKLQVLCCLGLGTDPHVIRRLVADFGVNVLQFHPIDREELARQVARILGLRLQPVDDTVDEGGQDILAAIWEEFRTEMVTGLDVIDRALAAIDAGSLDEDLRRSAVSEAHKLAGSVGTAGFTQGTKHARELEHRLHNASAISRKDIPGLVGLSHFLRGQIGEEHQSTGNETAAESTSLEDRVSRLLIIDQDRQLGERLAREAATRGIQAALSTDILTARQYIRLQRPDVVLLDPTFPDGGTESMTLLTELTRSDPPVPVLVLTESDTLTDPVDVARRGGRGFLRKPLAPSLVIEGVTNVLQRARAFEVKVLAVDDDPQILATLRALLSSRTVRVSTLTEPLRIWETLEQVSPDLLVFDVDMPHISGIELCRIVRNDPRWKTLPVLFLTANSEPDLVQRLFSAGADDYVSKPIVGPELVTRVTNRVERTRLHRRLAETDALTGLPNRHKAGQLLNQYVQLATENHEPLSLAIVDIDRFKQVNDGYGHLAGDDVLRRFGNILLDRFRSDDVIARWGGEEFVVGMYGMTEANAIRRLRDILEEVRREEFRVDGDVTFHVTFSAGVAAFPADGQTVQLLFKNADEALYRAKETGRNRVLPSSNRSPVIEGAA